MSELKDLRISGFGSNYGGEYNKVKLEGLITIKDNLKCVTFSSEGMCKCEGELIADEITTEGTFKISGNVRAKKISVEGIARFIDSCVNADQIKSEGVLQCNELSADNIKIDGVCRAEKIFGELIEINPKLTKKSGIFNIFNNADISKVDLIECTELVADGLNADIIRASRVKLGKYCEVNLLEYSESIEIHPEAKVKELVKV